MVGSAVKRFISKNKQNFLQREALALSEKGEAKRIQLISQAALYAIHNPCGILNSAKLESSLVDIAQKHSVALGDVTPNSVLHVFTVSYLSGGHTRICERWINASPLNQKTSVALISQSDRPCPQKLYDLTKQRAGAVIRVVGDTPLEKALNLRQIASTYECVVLHVHMQDVVPVLAFGTDEFNGSILLYNHADHLFWFGCSISDQVVNFRSLSAEMSEKFRGISNNTILPLPVEGLVAVEQQTENLEAVRKTLGVAQGSKVILTVAGAYKYTPSSGVNFFKVMQRILDEDPNAVLIAIGPSLKDPDWKVAFEKSKGRIKAIGTVPYEELGQYVQIADVAVDSFPLSSFTALLDIARYKVPCVMLESPINSFDCFEKAGVVCKTEDELVKRVLTLLKSKAVDTKLFDIIQDEHMPEGVAKSLEHLSNHLPKKHVVKSVKQDNRDQPSDFEVYIADNSMREHGRFKNRLQSFVRRLIYMYVLRLYPIGMTPRIYDYLSSRGLM